MHGKWRCGGGVEDHVLKGYAHNEEKNQVCCGKMGREDRVGKGTQRSSARARKKTQEWKQKEGVEEQNDEGNAKLNLPRPGS